MNTELIKLLQTRADNDRLTLELLADPSTPVPAVKTPVAKAVAQPAAPAQPVVPAQPAAPAMVAQPAAPAMVAPAVPAQPAQPVVPAMVAPAQPVVPAQPTAELDADGVEWQADLHSSSKVKTKKGVWKKRKGVGAVKPQVIAPTTLGNTIGIPQPADPANVTIEDTNTALNKFALLHTPPQAVFLLSNFGIENVEQLSPPERADFIGYITDTHDRWAANA